MSGKGTLTAQIFTAKMAIPVENAAVTLTQQGERGKKLIAYLITDISGKTQPVTFVTPDLSQSVMPGYDMPYTVCDVKVEIPDFYTVEILNAQIFPYTNSIQPVEMIPAAEGDDVNDPEKRIVFDVTPQKLGGEVS